MSKATSISTPYGVTSTWSMSDSSMSLPNGPVYYTNASNVTVIDLGALRLQSDGRVYWNGREITGDEEFKAMLKELHIDLVKHYFET